MNQRSYYSNSLKNFIDDDNGIILSKLVNNHQFDVSIRQRNSWIEQIEILKNELNDLDSGQILFEYSIPRMGKRVDIIFIYLGFVFVIEFKVNATEYINTDVNQCLSYTLDLKDFQEQSHDLPLVPILVATDAPDFDNNLEQFEDKIFKPIKCNSNNFKKIIQTICENFEGNEINPEIWEKSIFKPTPTIIEASQVMYREHSVEDISRSDSGVDNLKKTGKIINDIIERSKKNNEKSICFITGVPGAGKTLAGLNLANERRKIDVGENAVFLSGNGPLVQVLQEALIDDTVEQAKKEGLKVYRTDARGKVIAFIQNIHNFRDAERINDGPPDEKVAIFDEAQRAWDKQKLEKHMSEKNHIENFGMSEPEFLISIMDKHKDWAVIVCLIGGGQEIYEGEAGLVEWFDALKNNYSDWKVYVSDIIKSEEYTENQNLEKILEGVDYQTYSDLHLKTSLRSFKSENVSDLIQFILDGKIDAAKETFLQLNEFPIMITRDYAKAKQWLRQRARGNEKYGIVASSKAKRLRPFGIVLRSGFKSDVDPPKWFLRFTDDVRSSSSMEIVASEFDVQGLELDYVCVAWDANFRYDDNLWSYHNFSGNTWKKMKNEQDIKYLKNAYRVLLTRARKGMIIFIPEGDIRDKSRKSEYYDGVYNYFIEIGMKEV